MCWEGERHSRHERDSLHDSCWFSCFSNEQIKLFVQITVCQCFSVGGPHGHRKEFSLNLYLSFFRLHIGIRQSSSQIPRRGMSRDKRGSESRPLITGRAPAASLRDSFTKKNCVKRPLAVSLLYYNSWAERMCIESGHEVGGCLFFCFILLTKSK